MSVSSARGWLLEIFGRERDGRFLGVCNPGTAARGLFGDLGLLSAHTCRRVGCIPSCSASCFPGFLLFPLGVLLVQVPFSSISLQNPFKQQARRGAIK